MLFVAQRELRESDGELLSRRHAQFVLDRNYDIQEVEHASDSGEMTLEYVLRFRLCDLERRMGLSTGGGVSSIARSVLGAAAADSVISLTEVARVSTRSPCSVHIAGRGSAFGQSVFLTVDLERDQARASLQIASPSESTLLRAGLALASPLLQIAVQTALDRYVNDLRNTTDEA